MADALSFYQLGSGYLSFLFSVVVLVFPWKMALANSSTVVPRHWAALCAA